MSQLECVSKNVGLQNMPCEQWLGNPSMVSLIGKEEPERHVSSELSSILEELSPGRDTFILGCLELDGPTL